MGYQHARMQPRRLRARSLSWLAFGASALIAALGLWAGGSDPTKWYGWFLEDHVSTAHEVTAHKAIAPHAAIPPSPSRASSGPLPGATSSVSATPQELVLTSVVVGRSIKEGYAMLGVARENPQTYSAGALLANGARLSEIHSEYVVLERNGRSTKLYLQGTGDTAKPVKSSRSLITVGGVNAPRLALPDTTERLTDYLRPTPVYDGSALTGYQVYPGNNASVFAQMRLQSGDIITAIDGEPLDDPARGITVLHRLLDGAGHSASIARNGTVLELSLDGSLMAN
jgi:type II secretion system protein C